MLLNFNGLTKGKMEFDLENPLTGCGEHHFDAVSALFASESDHLPSFLAFKSTDVRFCLRRHSLSLISQVNTLHNSNFSAKICNAFILICFARVKSIYKFSQIKIKYSKIILSEVIICSTRCMKLLILVSWFNS